MSNCSQINNTTIIGTSDVFYDGPQLPCSNIETCDTLTVAFEKLDELVCVIIEDVESLTNEVNNIEENLVDINNTLVIINNQLNICCPTTTTTSSSTSTTTTSTSSTTTTTTTEPPLDLICFCLFLEGVGCGAQYSFPLLGNGPLFNGRPTYNFLPFLGYPAQVYYNGSNWVFYSSDLDLTQPLINSNYYPVGDYLDWGTVTVTGLMNSSSLGPCSEITTTTTSSSSTTTTTSTSTSTTTTSTTTIPPTTTTTTTLNLLQGLISTTSDVSDACPLPLIDDCWVSGPGDINNGDIVYTDALGTTPFVGDGNFYHIQILAYPDSYSVQIDGAGVVDASLGGICP